MTQEYFVIHNKSIGIMHVKNLEKEDLLSYLRGSDLDPGDAMRSIDQYDSSYWGKDFLIIKGEIVTPTPFFKVTEWKIP